VARVLRSGTATNAHPILARLLRSGGLDGCASKSSFGAPSFGAS
jgi:hypothetical protein